MSYLLAASVFWYPPASAGVSMTPSGTAWTNPAGWTTLLAIAPQAILLTQLAIDMPDVSTTTEFEIDLARGAAGQEVLLGTYAGAVNNGAECNGSVTFRLPLSLIGAGDRIACRIRLSTTETNAWKVRIGYYLSAQYDSDQLTSAPLLCLPSNADGLSLTFGGSPAWTIPAWSQLTTGFPAPVMLVGLVLKSVGSTDFEIDIATGGAGSETVVGTFKGIGGATGMSYIDFPRPVPIDASIRVALRIRQSSTSAGSCRAKVQYYGVPIPAVPSPGGGGTPTTGTNPDAGISLCGGEIPFVWHVVQTDSGEQAYAHADNSLGAIFHDGIVTSAGVIHRAMSNTLGGVETAIQAIELFDGTRALRAMADAGTLLNKRVDTYMSTKAGIIAGVTPRRVNQGHISRYKPLPQLKFRIELEDWFSKLLNALNGMNVMPQRTVSDSHFPNVDPKVKGTSVPILYGLCSDEALGASALGVVPARYVGQRVVDGTTVWEFLVCGHAVKQIQAVFIPSGGGLSTGTAEPSRTKITTDQGDVWFPGGANWAARVGSNPYVEYGGHRYTVIYMLGPRAELAADGRVPLALNVAGIEAVGDGSGALIDSLPLQIQHLIVNWMIQNYTGGSWLSIPTIGSPAYARVRSSSFTAAKTVSEARIAGGYLGAFMLGWEGQFHPYRDVIRDALQSCDLDLFINKDGQVAVDMLDPGGSIVKAWSDQIDDMVRHSFDSDREFNELLNRVHLHYQRRYVAPVTTVTPDTGAFLPASLTKDAKDWLIESTTPLEDSTSITNHGGDPNGVRPFDLHLPMVRDQATAEDVWLRKILKHGGKGPQIAKHEVGAACGMDVDLADVQTLTHLEGPTGSGWTDQPLRVETIDTDCDRFVQAFSRQRDLEEILSS